MSPSFATQKQKNGFKLQLLRDKCEGYQRKIFHKKFPTNPKQLYVELKKHDKEFQNLLKSKGKLLKQAQYDILLPASGETNSEKFDCTLLALLLRLLCGYKKPLTGWNDEPDVGDRSEIANLIRLKIGRNAIQHNPLEIETNEYKHWYNYLKQPLIDLGCPQSEIDNLLDSFQYGLFPVDPLFIGREKELDDLNNEILQNPLGVVLVGIGGVGKSETTRKYWEMYQNQFDGNVIWINANTKLSIEDTFKTVAGLLDLQIIDPSTKKLKPIKTLVKMVHDYFKDDKVLLIFDNCSEDTKFNIADFISANHSVIITSQLRNWGQHFHEIDIDPFTPAYGKLFLNSNLNQSELSDIKSQNGLLSILENHPLAIQHAVAYMKETKTTTAEYLKLLQEYKIPLLSTTVTIGQGASASVLGCLDMTLQQIKTKSVDAFKLLNIISFLDGKYIHRELLKIALKNEFVYVEALRLLQSRSIIKCYTSTIPGKRSVEIVTIHGLYQTAIRADQERNGIIEESLNMVFDLFFDKYTAQRKLHACHVNFGTEWHFHFLHILNQESLAQYALERVSKNQLFVFNSCFTKNMRISVKEIWNKLIVFLQWDKTSVLLYEARLLATSIDVDLNGCNEKRSAEFYELFKEIKQNITEGYSKSFAQILSISLNAYEEYNNSLPQHKRKPYVDFGIQQPNYFNRVELLMKKKKYLEVLDLLNIKEMTICENLGANHIYMAEVHSDRGRCYRELNEFDKAMKSFRKAEAVNVCDPRRAAIAVINISILLYCQSDYKNCLVELKRVEQYLSRINDKETRDAHALDCDIRKTMCLMKLNGV